MIGVGANFVFLQLAIRMHNQLLRLGSIVNEIAQIRHHQGSPTDQQRCTVPRTVRLHVADFAEGRITRVL